MGIDGIDPEALTFNWDKSKTRAREVVKKLTGGVNFLLKKNGIEVIQGEAVLTSANSISVENRTLKAKNILLATGSYPAGIGFDVPADKYLDVEKMLDLESLPQNIVIYGHGPTTLEIAQFFQMIDLNVTVVSPEKNLLPGIDKYLREFSLKKARGQGIKIFAGVEVSGTEDGNLKIGNDTISFDLLINCSWRKAIIPENNLDFDFDDKGYIKVNEHLETSVSDVYAAGDMNGLSYLAHAASAQGIFVVNRLQGVRGQMDINQFPVNVYTNPEMSQIGLTEEQVRETGIDYRIGEFPMTANGKALAEDAGEGFIRILSEKKFGEVLGVQIVAANATDLIAEAAAFMSVEATVYDVARTVHAHPTISEVFLEAGMDAADKPIHK